MLRQEAVAAAPLWFSYRQLLSASLLFLSNLFILSLVFLHPPLEGRLYLLLWLALLDLESLSSSLRYRTFYLERSARHRAFAAFWLCLTSCGLAWYGGNGEQRWMATTVLLVSAVELLHGTACARKIKRGGLERDSGDPATDASPALKAGALDRSL